MTGPTPYARSPVFDETTLPDSLRNEHRTKPGVWGLVRMINGNVSLTYIDSGERILVSLEKPGLIRPEQPHYVEPLGPMKMQVEFFREQPDIVA